MMELNDDLFKSHKLHQCIKNVIRPRRALIVKKQQYIWGRHRLYSMAMSNREMPKPLRINRRTVWDIHQLDECFDALFAPDDAPTPISSSADFNPDEARDILTVEIAMPDQRHPDALRLMRLAEQEIARIATEVGPQEAAQAAVMTAVRSLGTLYFAVGFDAAMRALQTIHDAAEGEIMRLSLSERSRSKVDAELERIGIKLAAQLPEKPRYTPGKKVP
jgi:hypothetical protein